MTTTFTLELGHTHAATRYCGPSSNALVFRLFDPGWVVDRWHASDLLINYIGGGGWYIGRGASMQIVDAAMHTAAQIF